MDKGVYSHQGPHRMGRGDLVGRTTVVGRSGRSALEPAVLQGLLLAALCAAGEIVNVLDVGGDWPEAFSLFQFASGVPP